MNPNTITVLAVTSDSKLVQALSQSLQADDRWSLKLECVANWHDVQFHPDARLADLLVLDESGQDDRARPLLARVRAEDPARPVIVLTNNPDLHYGAELRQAGADDYLFLGDLTADALRRSIQGALAQAQLRRENAILTQQLLRAQQMESVGTLAGAVAHDFKNMLTVATGYVDLAVAKSASLELKRDLSHVQMVCEQMNRLAQRLLMHCRPKRLPIQRVDIAQSLADAEVILRHMLANDCELHTEIAQTPLSVMGNPLLINQALMALCVNAAQAMPEGGGLRIRADRVGLDSYKLIGRRTLPKGDYVVIEVADSGVGMSQELIDTLLEASQLTGEQSLTQSAGLGISVVWKNLKEMNGQMDVTSTPGQGSTFTIYLPAAGEEKSEEELSNSADPWNPALVGHEWLLVVEDDPTVRDLTERMLSRLGYHVVTASDGAMALTVYQTMPDKIAATILDLTMPGMDGRQCIGHLREINPDARVIFSSGHDIEEDWEDLKVLGAMAVIQKPFSLVALARTVRAVLDANDKQTLTHAGNSI